MKLAILGGSFNPIHGGHLFLADLVLSSLGYDRIVLVPAFQSPFKIGAEAPSPEDRLAMVAASIPGDPRITWDPCEIRREGVSYTIDTVGSIARRYCPEGKPGLIIGDDLAPEFPLWRRAEEIASQTDIIIARRTGSALKEFPFPCRILDNEVINISSCMVREKIEKGENWRYLVPQGARVIIEEKGLYGLGRSPERASPALIVQVEDYARSVLSPGRFLHSRNTALLSRDLCLRFGLDPEAGYLAGIAHDICKSMSGKEQLKLAGRDTEKLSQLEKKKPALLHGRAAAALLRERFKVEDKDILDAVRYHTICGMGMGSLAKIVYTADKIEVSREDVSPELRALCGKADLNALFGAVLGDTVEWLQSNRMDVSESSLRLLKTMRKKTNGKSHEKDKF